MKPAERKDSCTEKTGKQPSRRKFLEFSAVSLSLLGLRKGNFPSPGDHASLKLKIVIAGGHPGDPEYGCGGLITRSVALGHEVVLLYLNRGEGGIEGKTGSEAAEIRTAEAMHACKLLGARPVFASQVDGQSIVDAAHYDEINRLLAAEKPDLVFTQWPIDNHPDHRAISTLVFQAWKRLADENQGQQPALYYYEVSNGEDTLMFSPTHYIDISEVETVKHSACYAHASQSPGTFYPLQDRVAQFRGFECGCPLAEAYIGLPRNRFDWLSAIREQAGKPA